MSKGLQAPERGTVLIKHASDIKASEITPEHLYLRRREFFQTAGAAVAGVAGSMLLPAPARAAQQTPKIAGIRPSPFAVKEPPTRWEDATSYTNFYEFGTDKASPAREARSLRVRPWTVRVDGEVSRPGTYALDDLIRPFPLEERIYRFRCVEGWSMVIPWVGFPLGDLLKRFEPTPQAAFVEFTTLLDPQQMPGQRSVVLAWPYREGLRLDEAMLPLTLLAVGLYGRVLPNQNGAPLRLIVPWKYGFKSIKSIVRIRLMTRQPTTSWQQAAPAEYGFYANVNPAVDHPRWSQARERRLGELFKRDTLLFNGYGDQVAGLYAGMDLRKYY